MVTGGTGFIGSYIVRELVKRGFENVFVLKRKSSRLELLSPVISKISFAECDIMDVPLLTEKLDGIHHIIHAAAIVSYDPNKSSLMDKTTVEGTANIVNLALDLGIKSFVHISSIAAIGRQKDNQEINEEFSWKKSIYNSHYGITKFLAEQEVWRGYAEGLNVAIVNPSFVFGGGFWDSSSLQIINKVKEGIPYFPKGGNGFVDVRDVSFATCNLFEKELYGERFIISSENWSYKNLINTIGNKLNVKVPKRYLSTILGNVLWRMEKIRSLLTKKEPVFTKESFLSSSINVYYDNNKSKVTLGIEYKTLQQTLDDTLECYIETNKKGYGVLPL